MITTFDSEQVMQSEEIKQQIESHIADSQVNVLGEDGVHFEAHIIAEAFVGKSRLQRERMVYAALGDHLQTGVIHALSIKTFTPEEWKHKNS